MSNRIPKPSRSNRKSNASNASNGPKFCPECGHKSPGKYCPECGTNLTGIGATAETPAAKPKHESAPFHGGKIWIGNASGRAWIDGADLNELRKAFDFKADEYKPKSKSK